MNRNKIISSAVLVFIIISLPLTLILVKQRQNEATRAATPDQLETEEGVLGGNAKILTDSLASGGQYVTLDTYSTKSDPIVGVIRWDAWSPNLYSGTSTQLQWLTADLPKWHYRLPFFADVPANPQRDVDVINEDRQDVIDQEILFASSVGIDYWAFDWYRFWWQDNDPSWHYNYGLRYYLNSPYKNRMNFAITIMCCAGVERYPSDWETKIIPQILAYTNDQHYQTVLNGRPLIFVFDATYLRGWFNCGFYNASYGTCGDATFDKSRAALEQLRAAIRDSGHPNPYLVAMAWDPGNSYYTSSQGYGFDAVSAYSGVDASIQVLTEKTYADLTTDNNTFRERAKTAGNKIVPPVNTGWDRRPDPNYHKVWYDPGTPTQVGANLKAAIDWNKANPTFAEANSVLIYAWNEFTEGGWLGPTLEDKGARINAIADVLGGSHVTIPSPTP